MIVFTRTNFAQSNVDQRWGVVGVDVANPASSETGGFRCDEVGQQTDDSEGTQTSACVKHHIAH
jgi:hypothetical protein